MTSIKTLAGSGASLVDAYANLCGFGEFHSAHHYIERLLVPLFLRKSHEVRPSRQADAKKDGQMDSAAVSIP
jgi:hypothetical protein